MAQSQVSLLFVSGLVDSRSLCREWPNLRLELAQRRRCSATGRCVYLPQQQLRWQKLINIYNSSKS